MTEKEDSEFTAKYNESKKEKYNKAIHEHLQEYVELYQNYSDEQLNRMIDRLNKKQTLNNYFQDFTFENAAKKSTTRTCLSIISIAGGAVAATSAFILQPELGKAFFPLIAASGIAVGIGISELLFHNTSSNRLGKEMDKSADLYARLCAIEEVKNLRSPHPFETDYTK